MSQWRGHAFTVHEAKDRGHGGMGFVFASELSRDEAAAFEDEVGVWPIHTVNGELRATKPSATQRRTKNTKSKA